MAGRFWFGKRSSNDGAKPEAGAFDEHDEVGTAVISNAVFPIGFNEDDEDFSMEASDLVLDSVKQDVEAVKNKIVAENKSAEKSIPLLQNYGILDATEKERSMNLSGNQGGVKFATRTIPGVIDGGKPDGRPVLTPVRRSLSDAPVKLKSVSRADTDGGETSRADLIKPAAVALKPTTSALKVINKEPRPVTAEMHTKFGLHVRQPDEPVQGAIAGEKNSVPEDYIKPKGDQRVLYYQLMNGLYDAVLVLDDDGHVVDCNDRVLKVLGFTREDAWDLPIEKVIKGMNSQMFAHLKRNLAESHHVLITARCYKSDGDSFKGEIGVSTLSLTREHNVVFAIRNVDQRKSAMAELRKSASAFEVALVPAFACNLEGFFTVVNKSLMDAFGIPDDSEAKKVRFVDILPDAARAFAKCVTGEKRHETIVVATAEGRPVRVEIALAPIMNGREVTGIAGSILQL